MSNLVGCADGTAALFSHSGLHSTKCLRGREQTVRTNQEQSQDKVHTGRHFYQNKFLFYTLFSCVCDPVTHLQVFVSGEAQKKLIFYRGIKNTQPKSAMILPVCLPSLYLPSQQANSLKVTRLLRSWSSRVKVRLASVSACWLEPPGHGASSPYRLLNWGRSSRYCRSR